MAEKIECETCGENFEVPKENIYQVKIALRQNIFYARNSYDAVDCPSCGCRTVLKPRMEKVDENADASKSRTAYN